MSKFLDVGGIKFRIVGENHFYYALRAPHAPGAQLVPKLPVDMLLELADLGVDARRIATFLADTSEDHLISKLREIGMSPADLPLDAYRPMTYGTLEGFADFAFRNSDFSRLAKLSQDYPRHFCSWAMRLILQNFSVSFFDSEQAGFVDGVAGPLGEVFAPSESDHDTPVLPESKKKKKK